MEEKIVLDSKSFEALATGTRVKILKSLLERKKTLSEISKEFGMSVSGVKEHLDILLEATLIIKLDDGHKWKYYTLTNKGRQIVTPQHKGARILLLLLFSFVIFTGSMYSLMDLENGDLQTNQNLFSNDEQNGSVMAIRGEPVESGDIIWKKQPVMTEHNENKTQQKEPSDLPLLLTIALLSFGTMIVCIYELVKNIAPS